MFTQGEEYINGTSCLTDSAAINSQRNWYPPTRVPFTNKHYFNPTMTKLIACQIKRIKLTIYSQTSTFPTLKFENG